MQQKMCGHLVVHQNNKVTLSLSRELVPHESIIPILRRHTFIMNDYPSNVKQKLNSIIADMSEHHWLFSNSPLSINDEIRFHCLLSNTFFRNSHLRFRLLQINSRIIVSLPVMAAMLSTLLILKLLRSTTSLVSSTIKDTTICT